MIILKGLKKLLVLPIILVLVFIWLIVKTLVSLYEIVHGIVYLFVIIFSILLIAVYGDWLQTGLLAVIGFTSFLLLAVGVLGESDVRIDNKADLELLIASRKKFAFITKIIGLGKIILIEKKFYVY